MHFITSTVVGFVPIFEAVSCAQVFIENLRYYQKRGDFAILAWVLMPEHFHLLIKRAATATVSAIVGNFKRMTSRQISEVLEAERNVDVLARLRESAAKEPTSDSRVWQCRFDSLVILNEQTLHEKMNYIHNNPVKRGLVARPELWGNSSAGAYGGRPHGIVEVDVDWQCLGYGKLPSGKGS